MQLLEQKKKISGDDAKINLEISLSISKYSQAVFKKNYALICF